MLEKLNDCHEADEAVPSTDRLVFLDELPVVPVYAESLPTGLIEDEI